MVFIITKQFQKVDLAGMLSRAHTLIVILLIKQLNFSKETY